MLLTGLKILFLYSPGLPAQGLVSLTVRAFYVNRAT